MSALMHPVGPKAPRVYWVRRLLVLAVLVTVVTVVLVVVNGALGGAGAAQGADGTGAQDAAAGDGTDGTDAAADTAAGDAGQTDQAADDSGTPQACAAGQVALALTTDARSYAAGGLPVFTVTITNVSDTSCTIDAGEASREVLITSGSDRIWSSLDCAAEPAERILLLAAGARDDYPVTWPRIRSAQGCTQGLAEPRAGTYTAAVNLAGMSSSAAVFDLG